MRFRPALALLAIVVVSPLTARAQSLAECVSADALAYFRFDDPVGDWEKITGSGELWTQPQKVSAKSRAAMEKGMKHADQQMGKEEGTAGSWLRSIGSIELALFSLDFGGDISQMEGPPLPDFAASLESPAAIEMYNTMAQMMIDRGAATRNERGDLVMSVPGVPGMAPLMSVQGNRLFLASSDSRLNSIVAAIKGGGMPNSLASNPNFHAVVGDGRGPRVAFMRMGALLQLIRDNLPEEQQKRMSDIINPLGLPKVAAIGYREDGPNGVFTAKGDGPVTAFQLLRGKLAPPTLQSALPIDTAFTFGHTNDFGEHIKRIEKYLGDPKTFPFAPAVGTGLLAMSVAIGMSLDQAVTPIKDGVVFAAIPDENGRLKEEQSMVLVARMPVKEEAEAFIAKATKSLVKSADIDVEQSVDGAVTWFKLKRQTPKPAATQGNPPPSGETPTGDPAPESAPSRRPRGFGYRPNRELPTAAYTNGTLVVGYDVGVKKVVASLASQGPNLASTGAFKRLPPQATFYFTGSLKSIFSNGNNFAPALSFLKDFGSFGGAVVAEDDSVTVTFNRAPGQFMSIMATGGMMYDESRDQRREILDRLDEIGKKTLAYKEQNKKWPTALTDLGYAPDKLPAGSDAEGKSHPMVYLPPKADPGSDGFRQLLAYWNCNDYGRLCVDLNGNARSWSESEFIGALAKYNTVK